MGHVCAPGSEVLTANEPPPISQRRGWGTLALNELWSDPAVIEIEICLGHVRTLDWKIAPGLGRYLHAYTIGPFTCSKRGHALDRSVAYPGPVFVKGPRRGPP